MRAQNGLPKIGDAAAASSTVAREDRSLRLHNESGGRFQLACDEEQWVIRLNVRMPGDQEWPLSPVTLEDVAIAVMRRRAGYVFDWTRVASIETQRRSR